MQAVWAIAKKISQSTAKKFPEIHQVVLQLLHNRNITTQKEIERFMTPDYQTDSHDPFLFRDMRKAVDRIFVAISSKEQVAIFGDYDADGVSASVILSEVLEKLGIIPHVHLPHREKEGYGLNMHTVKEFIKKRVSLVITCDCGITSIEEIAHLQKHSVDVIITDHHLELKKIPNAYAILNPALPNEPYPFKHLVGTGVAFKLAQALLHTARNKGFPIKDGEEKWLLDLVAIATIADFGPLISENRTYTKFGLVVLEKTRRPGLRALIAFMSQKSGIDATSVAFQLIPRLNAASRMEHANTAFQLLRETNPVQASKLAERLNGLNQDRQKVSDSMFAESERQIIHQADDELYIIVGDGWGAGILGLVAGKLLNVHKRPVLVIGKNKEGIVGSGRSIEAFDITKALEAHADLLEKFGGHPQACGFTVKQGKLDIFMEAMKRASRQIKRSELKNKLIIDGELALDDISWELWDDLRHFEPYGEGNPRPRFVCQGVKVESIRAVGSTSKHLQIMVHHDGGFVKKTIAFGFAQEWSDKLPKGKVIDIVYEVSINEWNGNRELQIKLVDIRE